MTEDRRRTEKGAVGGQPCESQENRRGEWMRLAEGREGAPSPKSVTGKSFVMNNVNEHSGSRRKQKKQKSDEEEGQTNRNGT